MTDQTALKIEQDDSNRPRKALIDNIKICEERRIDLSIVEEIFEGEGVDVIHRWSSLTAAAASCGDDAASNITEKVDKLLTNHILYDDKLIMIFDRLLDGESDEFNHAFSEVYSVDDAFEDSEYIADSSYDVGNDVSIYCFQIIREISERKELTESDLGELASVLDKYNRVIGYRPVKVTCYDAVIVDTKNNRVILQLDLGSIVLANAVDKFFHKLITSINKAFDVAGVTSCRLPEKVQFENLYNAIQKFYDNDEGEVTSASFSTSKNNHHETLRDRARDIRKAEYHLRGKVAEEALGGKIRPYRISKRFERVTNKWPQVYAGIHYRYFNKPGLKSLYEAHIFDIKSYKDYSFIIDKILANR